jgi:glycosyltransferase involved in cell wall biosynthesis
MVCLSVAMCTYNGAKYLSAQLESIARQTCLPDELIICDDHSTDATPAIVEQFGKTAPFRVRLFHNPARLGVVTNFSKAITLASGRYIALSDQDDIWLPKKLEHSLLTIRTAEESYGPHTPLLVHTDLSLLSEGEDIISTSFMRFQHLQHVTSNPLRVLLTQNFVTGCTVLMNAALKLSAIPIPAPVLMHDWWFALVAATIGKIEFLDEQTVLYRQHGSNNIGAVRYSILSAQFILKKWRDRPIQLKLLFDQTQALLDRLEEKSQTPPSLLLDYLNILQTPGIHTCSRYLRLRFRKQGHIRNLWFLTLLLLGR